MSTYKVRNYNISYEILLEAIKAFESFVPGGRVNNSIFAYSVGQELFKNPTDALQYAERKRIKKLNEDIILKEIAPRILDRTTGTFFLCDILTKKAFRNSLPENIRDYIEIFHEPNSSNFGNFDNYASDIFNTFYSHKKAPPPPAGILGAAISPFNAAIAGVRFAFPTPTGRNININDRVSIRQTVQHMVPNERHLTFDKFKDPDKKDKEKNKKGVSIWYQGIKKPEKVVFDDVYINTSPRNPDRHASPSLVQLCANTHNLIWAVRNLRI